MTCHSCKMQPCIRTNTQDTLLFLTILSVLFTAHLFMAASQQDYPSRDYSRECDEHYSENEGYHCEPSLPICDTLAYFRVQSGPFSSLSAIAQQLFNTSSLAIATASNLSTLSTPQLNPGKSLYIPFTCACNGKLSSHNITYTVMAADTFQTISNATYEGLTTCQALQDANPRLIASELKVGTKVTLPLRCACPSPAQTLRGIKLLVTYPTGRFPESISSVVNMFGLNETEFLLANRIVNRSAMLFSAITVLLPFKEKPTVPPNANVPPATMAAPRSSIMIHIIAASATPAILVILIVGAVFYTRKCNRKHVYKKTFLNAMASPNMLPSQSRPPPINLFQVMSDLAMHEKLIVYSFDEINQATEGFNVSMRIKGTVYRGTLAGQTVAVKKTEKDLSREVRILQRLHHSNIISLLGVCVPSPSHALLVYEYAESGSLHDWLHGHSQCVGLARSLQLGWHERLQIAFDISLAMEYIHEHTYPRYVHNQITSSNILLDSKKRGKMANFSLAKVVIENNANLDPSTGLHRSLEHVSMESFSSDDHLKGVRMSPQMDVYAFGIVLLEILSEKDDPDGNASAIQAIIEGHDAKERLRVWMYPGFEINVHMECAYDLAMLAYSCVAHDSSARPTARTVAFTLSKMLNGCSSGKHHFSSELC